MIHLHSIAAAAALTAFRHRNSADDLSVSRGLFSSMVKALVLGNACSSARGICAESLNQVLTTGGSHSRAGWRFLFEFRPPLRRTSHARRGGDGRLWMLDEKRSLSRWQKGR